MFAVGDATTLASDWCLVAGAEALYSDSFESDDRDGTYLRGSVRFAFWPIGNGKLNMQFMTQG